MADITMCVNKDCPKKGTCYRSTAKLNDPWQSHFSNIPPKNEDDECPYYKEDR